jgi:hypothetical protein
VHLGEDKRKRWDDKRTELFCDVIEAVETLREIGAGLKNNIVTKWRRFR